MALMARAPAAGAQSAATLASRRPMLAVHAFRKLPSSCALGIGLKGIEGSWSRLAYPSSGVLLWSVKIELDDYVYQVLVSCLM